MKAGTPTSPSSPTPAAAPRPRGDDELLRAHEPVLRFTRGELFLPTTVGRYVAQCSLWAGGPGWSAEPLVPAGELDLDRLGELGRGFRDRPLYLRFVQEPLSRAEVRAWRREDRPRLRGASRFAAVGLLARLIDVLLRISLLVRGRVPGGLVAAADRTTRAHLAAGGCPYYGRVVRDGGYTVLQYWHFYAFNDWRSTFHGVNDHEADWETVAVYLVGEGDGLRPAWVAASSHDHAGAVLRRRWDDPGLHLEGDHPVVFPGAGSHSGAFIPGDYVVSVEISVFRRAVARVRRWSSSTAAGLAVPFVDYARGDGVAVGPGHPRPWRLELIDDDTPWIGGFRGLWGLDTRDPFGGERAPGGPRYERSGEVRRSWADPLGWAGLATVAPTADDERAALCARIDELTDRIRALDEAVSRERAALRGLRAQARSLELSADTRQVSRARLAELATREAGLSTTTTERSRLVEERAVHSDVLSRPADPGPPDAHLRYVSLPDAVDRAQHTAFLRAWAAVSTPVLIGGIVVLLGRPTPITLSGFATFLVVFAGVEAVARRRLGLLLTVLAVAAVWMVAGAGLVLALLRNWQVVLAGLLVVPAVGLLLLNLRELVGPLRRARTAPPSGSAAPAAPPLSENTARPG